MKNILLIELLFTCFNLNAQTFKEEILSKHVMGNFQYSYVRYTTGDESRYYLNFRNLKYKYHLDIISIPFSSDKECEEFLNEVSEFLSEYNVGTSIYINEYYVSVHRKGLLYISPPESNGFFYLNKKMIDHIIKN